MAQPLPLRDTVLIYSGGLIVFILLLTTVFGPNGHATGHQHEESEKAVLAEAHDCSSVTTGKMIEVLIQDNAVVPLHTDASLCDTLRFINKDIRLHQPDSGPHPSHDSYPELNDEVPLKQGEHFDAKLTRLGEYSFHDHLDERIEGTLTVK